MVNPPKFNMVNEDRDNLKFDFTITNSNGGTFIIQDCYQKVTYDATAPTISPTVNTVLSDCNGGGKCGTINVLLRGCTNNTTMIVQMGLTFAGTLNVGDVISAAALAQLSTLVGLIVPSQGVDTCYTVGGQDNSVTSLQTNGSVGTGWSSSSYKYSVVADCPDNYCGCKRAFTVNNIGGVVQINNVKSCDGGTVYTIDVPASGSVTLSNCINMNSFWSQALIAGVANNLTISGSYIDCV